MLCEWTREVWMPLWSSLIYFKPQLIRCINGLFPRGLDKHRDKIWIKRYLPFQSTNHQCFIEPRVSLPPNLWPLSPLSTEWGQGVGGVWLNQQWRTLGWKGGDGTQMFTYPPACVVWVKYSSILQSLSKLNWKIRKKKAYFYLVCSSAFFIF